MQSETEQQVWIYSQWLLLLSVLLLLVELWFNVIRPHDTVKINEGISADSNSGVFQLRDGHVRYCFGKPDGPLQFFTDKTSNIEMYCGKWSD